MQAWEDFLLREELEIGAETVNKWLRTLKIVRFDAANLYLEAKDSFQALWFEEHIRLKVTNSLFNNNHKKIRVHLAIANRPLLKKGEAKPKSKIEVTPPLFELSYDTLDPLCTLENFVLQEQNQVPYLLLKDNLSSFNPIFLFGPPGSGKTHLLMGVAREQMRLGKKVIYTRAETFTDHVVAAIRAGEMGIFRETYRKVDLIVIDDIHLFSRKGATQEEFFHTFNALHLMGKQILLSSKCAPQELQEIEPRLVSRFEWGITLPLIPASGSEITPLLKKKAEALGYPLPIKVIEFLIESFQSGPKSVMRALEALILRSHVQSQSLSAAPEFRPMTVQLAKHYLADLLLAEKQAELTPMKVIQATSDHFGIRPEDILGKAQTRECTHPRQIAMYLCRTHIKLPFKEIGDIFSRDHSTVMSSVRLIEESEQRREPEFAIAISEIEKKIGRMKTIA